jgi:ATP-binding cassette subfamily B multidrug efflux pump
VALPEKNAVRAGARSWQILRSIVRLGDERVLDAMDMKALPYILRRILRMAWSYPVRLLLVIGTLLVATVFSLTIPRLLGLAVDRIHILDPAADGRGLWLIAALLVISSAGRGLATMVAGYQSEALGQRIAYDLRLAFFEKLQRLSFSFHDRIHSGDLITRGMLDLEGVRTFVETGMQRSISLSLLLAIGAVMMVRTDPLLAGVSLSFVPFVAWRAGRTGLFLRLTWTRLQQRMAVLTRAIEENLQGVRVVRAFTARDFEVDKFDAAADAALKLSNDRITIRSGSITALTLAFYAAMGLVLLVGGHRVLSGAISIGRLTEFLAFMTVLQTPVRQVTILANSTARAISSGSRLFEILDLPPAIDDAPGALALPCAKGILRFENVSFSYRPGAPRALKDVSFEVTPGKLLGIMGAPGAGKSTIAHLSSRFYDPDEGRITLDGHDIRGLTLASLRRHVGTIQQDVFLFDTAVADNIAYADPRAGQERIEQAAQTAQLHDHIVGLPLDYSTAVGERGVGLSGGQRQRLSIARGLLPAPAVLLFDDATSAVDAATEHRLRLALRQRTAGCACIIISHRVNSIMHADEILLLDAGRVAERGGHAALVARGGLYAEIVRLQAEGEDKFTPAREQGQA